MIENIQPLSAAQASAQQSVSVNAAVAQQVKEEFLALFYRELLKQSFQAPSLSINGEEDTNNLPRQLSSDIFVEHMAQELAKSGAISLDQVLPPEANK